MTLRPFANSGLRTIWLRSTLIIATILGLIAAAPVWSNSRSFPLLPIVKSFPILPQPLDHGLFYLLIGSLVAAFWFYRPAIITFLLASFLGYCGDQNRGQPWLYMYWAMLLFSLFPERAAISASRLAVTIVYLWAGVQKLNSRFFVVTPEWFVAPATQQWHWPTVVVDLFKIGVRASPFIELAIALLFWIPQLRRGALLLVVTTHLFALLFLGPWGHNYNWVVWPWNLAMVALAYALFSESRWIVGNVANRMVNHSEQNPAPQSESAINLHSAVAALITAKPLAVLVALYGLLPGLSYAGRWDSYFSFALYSENLAVANVFCTAAFRERLPAPLRRYVEPFPQAYDPIHQGPLLFVFPKWAYDTLNVPMIFEPRNFLNIYEALLPYAQKPEDLRIIIGPRSGPVIFREGNRVELLQPMQ